MKGFYMVSYEPLFNTMKKKGISTYTLEVKHGISNATVDRLKHNQPVTTTTLEALCHILSCEIQDIVKIT